MAVPSSTFHVGNVGEGATIVQGENISIVRGPAPTPADYVIDFRDLMETATRGFAGRGPVFAALESFRAKNPCGYVEIVAEAGLGKTALAAEIARRHEAPVFFASATRGQVRADQFLTHLCGAIIVRYQLNHDRLPPRAGEDSSFLGRLLNEAGARFAPVWIVVDGLDEAERPALRANPLLLPAHLPHGIYIVATHRPTGGQLFTEPDTPRAALAILRDAPDQEAAIEEYLRRRATEDGAIKAVLRDLRLDPETFVASLKFAARGNFMYLSYVLADIAARDPGVGTLDLARLPQGLQGYYEQFLSNMEAAKAEGWADWKSLFRPVLECLAVAAEAVSAGWLSRQVGRDEDEIRERALVPWQRLLSTTRTDGTETWSVVHRSFADFLAGRFDLRAAHRAVAERYLGQLGEKWSAWDDYGLRYVPMHLAAAAEDAAARHELVGKLAALVLNVSYQRRHLERLRDPNAFERTLDLTLRSLARDEAGSPALLAEAALRRVTFLKEQRQVRPIFDLARMGEVEKAEGWLDLFELEVDPAWYRALLLIVAMLGAPQSLDKAKRLRDRVRKNLGTVPPAPTLQRLMQWVDVAIDHGAPPVSDLPPAPAADEARAIVKRLTDAGVSRSLLANQDLELLARRELTGENGYLAEQDGPDLVAYAAADPARGEVLLKEYVELHAAYGYREYRQGSLWALLDAVLRHPRGDWVQAWAPALGAAVLAPNRGEFRENLGLAALALHVIAGEEIARQELIVRHQTAREELAELPESGAEVNVMAEYVIPSRGDTWGIHRRRFGALAEVFSRLPDGQARAAALVGDALTLAFGFAGFNAPACLALAEAIEVSTADVWSMQRALDSARGSAHNIQDSTFCARTTARVRAMTERWWGAPPPVTFDVVATARRLAEDPSAPEFAARHEIGEAYAARDPVLTIPLPEPMRTADTLTDLATVYQRPLEEFVRLNPGCQAGDPLPPGMLVNVPDPGFPPLLAARFAARALADPALSPDQRTAAIRACVPVATSEASALDRVLARLVLASAPLDPATLSRLSELASEAEAAGTPEATLSIQLTTYVA